MFSFTQNSKSPFSPLKSLPPPLPNSTASDFRPPPPPISSKFFTNNPATGSIFGSFHHSVPQPATPLIRSTVSFRNKQVFCLITWEDFGLSSCSHSVSVIVFISFKVMTIDKSWIHLGKRNSPEFIKGLCDFIEVARNHVDKHGKAYCPCRRCANAHRQDLETIYAHIHDNGFLQAYQIWNYHGEKHPNADKTKRIEENNVIQVIMGLNHMHKSVTCVCPGTRIMLKALNRRIGKKAWDG